MTDSSTGSKRSERPRLIIGTLKSSLSGERNNPIATERQFKITGKLLAVKGTVVLARIPSVAIGDLCYIERRKGDPIPAQVISFSEDAVTLAPFDLLDGVSPGASVFSDGEATKIELVGDPLGQVIDAFGRPLSIVNQSLGRAGLPPAKQKLQLSSEPPNPLSRSDISEILRTGVRSIDTLCTLAVGQRVGLFAGAGVGKSTLLGMITRNAAVDVIVIALVGERGREVNEFIHDSLGAEGLKRSVLVVSTSDESSIRRLMAAKTATAIAEHYRDQGKRVLLLIDSLTRSARAMREIGLAAGELPVRQGYTPSVFTELPKLLERAGNSDKGSISAIYTVLTNNEREVDPLAEEIKSLLDGHITLSTAVAQQGIRPAIDLTTSVSRVITRVRDREATQTISEALKLLARIKKDKDILLLGGTPDPELQRAIDLEPKLIKFLSQGVSEALPANKDYIDELRELISSS